MRLDGPVGGDGPGLDVAVAPDLASLETMRDEWMRLWTRSGASPFQAPACLLPWARHHAPDRVAAVQVREQGRLVGLIPVFSWDGRILLAGTGPTDFNDGVFKPGQPRAAEAGLSGITRLAAARHLAAIELHQLPPRSELLDAPCPKGWRSETGEGDVCPAAPVSGADGLGALPAGYPRKVRYNRKRFDGAGALIEYATPATLDEFWQALLDLHAKRWRRLGETGVLGDPLMIAFLGEALPQLLADDLLRLGGVRLAGRLVAVLCALRNPLDWFFYLTGFDPDLQSISPGSTLIADMFQRAAREGARQVQFLRGQEPYKYHWGAVDQPTFKRVLTRLC